jgi:hypothetical protein
MENQEFDLVTLDARTIRALLIAVERDIGATVVAAEDQDMYLICLNGPLSPVCKTMRYASYTGSSWRRYFAAFDRLVADAQTGLVRVEDLSECLSGGGAGQPGQDTCAFGQ